MLNIYDICLIGLGPAGIGVLSSLKENNIKQSICFEKGDINASYICNTNSKCSKCYQCSVISGVGGASRFSCGKISNYPAGSGLLPFWNSQEDSLKAFLNSQIDVLKDRLDLCKVNVSAEDQAKAKLFFEKNGITYKYYDVYEFKKEKYISYLSTIINKAQECGLKIKYNSEVLSIKKSIYQNENIYVITIRDKNGISEYFARKVIIATGNINSNYRLIQSLTNIATQVSYELGIRITIPTEKIASVLDYHGDLKLKYKNGRTYCVSRDGFIISYSINGASFLEGYTDSTVFSKLTNMAIIVKCDDLDALNDFKAKYTTLYNGIPIKQAYNDYIDNRASNLSFTEKYIQVQQGNVKDLFTDSINDNIIDFVESVLIKTIGLERKDIIIYAPELKETIKYNIKNNFQVNDNVFVIGAATGCFRGILQSMCSGMLCAKFLRR